MIEMWCLAMYLLLPCPLIFPGDVSRKETGLLQRLVLRSQPVELERQYEVSCQRTINSDGESLSEQNREVIFA